MACQPPDLIPELTTVGKEERRFPTEHDNPWEPGGPWVLHGVVPSPHLGHLAEDGAVGPPVSAKERQYGKDDCHDDPLEHAQENHANGSDEAHGDR